MTKIVIAPDSFKGSLTAPQICDAVEEGIREVTPQAVIIKAPMADGGEGTVLCLVNATGGKILKKEVVGPLGKRVEATYGILGDGKTAVIEMASASGLPLVPEEKRNPMLTTTYGTGELIKAALDHGCKKIIIGIGGSATNDGGVGMAQALGVRFLDKNGKEIGFGGKELKKIAKIDMSHLDERIKDTQILVASDVKNPLCGPNGASYVYGPQKGATPDMVRELDEGLSQLADIIKRDIGKDVRDIPGAGAAGGLGAGLMAFLGAKLRPGIELIMEAIGFYEKVTDSALVITGEGKMDRQTIYGKVPVGVAKVAKELGIPVLAICAVLEEDPEFFKPYGIDFVLPISPPMDMDMPFEKKYMRIKENIKRWFGNEFPKKMVKGGDTLKRED